jgi:hypothetical protein
MLPVLAIDFEASCLPRHGKSFPIEVGLCDITGQTRSWLIRPHSSWDGWDWTAEAESLHRLSRDDLWRDGLPANFVLAELTEAVRGHVVVADSSLDNYWLDTLASAVGTPRPCDIRHVSEWVDKLAPSPDEWTTAFAEVERLGIPQHRAADDARWLAALMGLLQQAKASRPIWGKLSDAAFAPSRQSSHAGFALRQGLQPALQQ